MLVLTELREGLAVMAIEGRTGIPGDMDCDLFPKVGDVWPVCARVKVKIVFQPERYWQTVSFER